MSKRYIVVEKSISGHCCFEATVCDTEQPHMVHGEHYRDHFTGELQYETVCECFDVEDAAMICDALNARAALSTPETP